MGKISKLKNLFGKIICLIVVLVTAIMFGEANAFADSAFSVSPMNQKIILTPGESYTGNFRIVNPGYNTKNFNYKLNVVPFYVDNDYSIIYETNGDCNQMVNWLKLSEETGTIAPNNEAEIYFSINVPTNAPAGGQYAAITVTSNDETESLEGGANLEVKYSISHIVYAEIAGTTVRKGEVTSADVPGFLLSGNIAGTSSIKNTGNVHGTATYKLQVFPLFSNEEIYTNEEEPETKTILPDRTLVNTTSWDKTPGVGIFNVVYTAEFEGVETKVEKMVIICPIWLLFVIVFAIIIIIFYFVTKSKSRKKK